MESTDVEFASMGATLRGQVYQSNISSGAAVVMGHGLSAVKEMFLDDYAESFSGAGLTTLVYDHFGFGESDGEPRQSPSASLQLQGYRDAVAFLAQRDGVDPNRVGIWGTSFSGGLVITLAAEDLPIACAVAQVPNLDPGTNQTPAGAISVITDALTSGDPNATVAAVTPDLDGDGIMYADDAYRWFTTTAAARAPRWRNELNIAGLVDSGSNVPLEHLPNTRVPLLLIVGRDDHLTPPAAVRELVATIDNVEVTEIPGGHFDAYEAEFDASCEAAIDWFQKHIDPDALGREPHA